MNRLILLAILAASAGAAIVDAQIAPMGADPAKTATPQDSVKSTLSGIYMTEQSERGAMVYNRCLDCHSADTPMDNGFFQAWAGKTLWNMYEEISLKMPESDPGSLSPQEVRDVMSYVLMMNGMPAGTDSLSSDDKVLKRIRMDTLPAAPAGQPSNRE